MIMVVNMELGSEVHKSLTGDFGQPNIFLTSFRCSAAFLSLYVSCLELSYVDSDVIIGWGEAHACDKVCHLVGSLAFILNLRLMNALTFTTMQTSRSTMHSKS